MATGIKDIETEMMVLGCMLYDRDGMAEGFQLLDTDDFFSRRHRLIFDAMRPLVEANAPCMGETVIEQYAHDQIFVRRELDKTNNLADAGGSDYLRSLVQAVISSANLPYFADIVLDCSLKRKLAEATEKATRMALETNTPAEEIIEELHAQVLEEFYRDRPSGLVHISSALGVVMARLKGGQSHLITTGFKDVDRDLRGLDRGEYAVLAARPSVGKSSMAYNIVENVFKEDPDATVLFFSLEVTADKVLESIAGVRANASPQDVMSLVAPKDVAAAYMEALDWISTKHLYVEDDAGITIHQVRARCTRHHRRHQLKLIVVDYAQLLSAPHSSGDGRQQELEAISRGLKALSKDADCPVLALCQLNREADGASPRLGHLKGSGAFEQDADKVLFLHREDDKDRSKVECIIGKNRHGPVGRAKLYFHEHSRLFTGLSNA